MGQVGVGRGIVAPPSTDVSGHDSEQIRINSVHKAYLEFKVRPQSELQWVGNAAATPTDGLYIVAPLDWGNCIFDG